MAGLSDTALAYAKSRGLSRSTLEAMRVASGMAFFPESNQKREALFFPHFANGEVVGWKARPSSEPKDFVSKPGVKYGLWNLDQVLPFLRESGVVYITEGEIDACSLVEAGIHCGEVLSWPHGASDKPPKEGETRSYECMAAALAAGLAKAEKFVLLTDNDGPGRLLRADLVQMIGPARCYFVEFPDGIKDANQFLTERGGSALLACVQQKQKPWPVDGLYRLSDIPEPPPIYAWDCGFAGWAKKLHFAPRTWSIATGHPGHGKTALLMQVWCQIAEKHGVRGAVASFETRAKPHHRRRVREFFHQKPERVLDDRERAEADKWNDEHFRWLVHPGQKPSLKWVLDLAEVAIVRYDCRFVQIDPWNKLESAKPDYMKETDYIGQCLDEVATFAYDMNCHVQIIAHPSKMEGRDRGKPPILEDIAGSKHWDNKTDLGVVVHRPRIAADGPERSEAEVYVRKARFDELGHPCKLAVYYDETTARFKEGKPGQQMREAA